MLSFYSDCAYPLRCLSPSFDGAIPYDLHPCQTTLALSICDKTGNMYACPHPASNVIRRFRQLSIQVAPAVGDKSTA